MFDTRRSLANPVLGVDACKSGWVGIRLAGEVTAHFARTIDELVTSAAPVTVVAIDIPIDRSSLFMTAVRAALEADTHRVDGPPRPRRRIDFGAVATRSRQWPGNRDPAVTIMPS